MTEPSTHIFKDYYFPLTDPTIYYHTGSGCLIGHRFWETVGHGKILICCCWKWSMAIRFMCRWALSLIKFIYTASSRPVFLQHTVMGKTMPVHPTTPIIALQAKSGLMREQNPSPMMMGSCHVLSSSSQEVLCMANCQYWGLWGERFASLSLIRTVLVLILESSWMLPGETC